MSKVDDILYARIHRPDDFTESYIYAPYIPLFTMIVVDSAGTVRDLTMSNTGLVIVSGSSSMAREKN